MKSLTNLTPSQEHIVDTILMRGQREWVNMKQLIFELKLPNVQTLEGWIRMLKAEGYVFETKVHRHWRTGLKEKMFRITDYKVKA